VATEDEEGCTQVVRFEWLPRSYVVSERSDVDPGLSYEVRSRQREGQAAARR
jgi:hypothetical protein